ncbi:MAG: LysM domain-containing protein [Gammaproteobacteria bacterium]|jgi:hypothetical protein|nr:MAG: LysM domain-containing protein [Gammaproteobacteria bacterium]
MLNKILLLSLLFLSVPGFAQDDVKINPDHPDSYVVVEGDTLWAIAGRFLTEPWRWSEIWETNPQIADPHLIYPGDVISLVYEGGQPRLTVSRGAGGVAGRLVKLSPEIRSHERSKAIPAIPIEAIRHFLNRPLVLEESEIDAWPYVLSNLDQHLISGARNKIYIRGLDASNGVKNYSIYRKGEPYIAQSHDSGTTLGYEAIHIGDAVIVESGEPATAMITTSNREIMIGDRLAPVSDEEIDTDYIPSVPGSNVQGNIIAVLDGVSQISQYQVVILDVGTQDGLQRGNVLGIYQSGKVVEDDTITNKSGRKNINDTALVEYLGRPKPKVRNVQLPEEYAGVVMIFRTFDRVSYGLIMEATASIHLHDAVSNL